MKLPRRVVRSHNKTITLSPEQYARKLRRHAIVHLEIVVDVFRSAPPEVQALLLADPAFVTALTWHTNCT
jgi:hypothetical protein